MISEKIKNFIKENKDLLNDCEFDKLYLKCYSTFKPSEVGEFTAILLGCNINPLFYMNRVPEYFLYENKSIKSIVLPDNIYSIRRLVNSSSS